MDAPQKKLHILITDDDEVMRRLFGSLLAKAGYEIIYAPDADQGRELARRFQPDLILMDKDMPGLDGLKAAERLNKEESERKVLNKCQKLFRRIVIFLLLWVLDSYFC